MGEMLERHAAFHQIIQHRLSIVLATRPENMIMRPSDNAYCVNLHKPQALDDCGQCLVICGTSWRLCQSLTLKPKPTGIAIGECYRHLLPHKRTGISPSCDQKSTELIARCIFAKFQ